MLQPLDALGASLDGALIGSSDVKWVSSASFFISGACFAALFTCRRLCPSLINYWLCMKVVPFLIPWSYCKLWRWVYQIRQCLQIWQEFVDLLLNWIWLQIHSPIVKLWGYWHSYNVVSLPCNSQSQKQSFKWQSAYLMIINYQTWFCSLFH